MIKTTMLITTKKVTWVDEGTNTNNIVVPVDKITSIDTSKYYEFKILSQDAIISKGIDINLHKNDITNGEITRLMLSLKQGYTKHPTYFIFSVMLLEHDVTKEQIKVEGTEATDKLKKLEGLFGIEDDPLTLLGEVKSTKELAQDVNELFKQMFSKRK